MLDSESLHAFHAVMYVEWLGLTYAYTTSTRPRCKSRDYEGFVSTIRCHPLRLIRYMFDSRKVELFKDQVLLCFSVLVPSSVSLCLSLARARTHTHTHTTHTHAHTQWNKAKSGLSNNCIRTSIQNEPHIETRMCEWTTNNFFQWLLKLIHLCEHQSAGRTMLYKLMTDRYTMYITHYVYYT